MATNPDPGVRPKVPGAGVGQRAKAWVKDGATPGARWTRAAQGALLGEGPTLAAGTALFALLAAVPTLAGVVAMLGVVMDPHRIQTQLQNLTNVLPPDVVGFIGDQLGRQAAKGHGEVSLAIAGSVIAAVYSARGAARSMILALNRAYRVKEQRKLLAKILVSVALAAGMLLGVLAMFATFVALPAIVALLGLKGYGLVHILRWPVLILVMFVALLGLYRYGPSPRPMGTERHLWPGAVLATALLGVVSWALSAWVTHVGQYELFYGAFGSIIVVILWFYLSTLALVIGGFLNAELERTSGAPDPVEAPKPD